MKPQLKAVTATEKYTLFVQFTDGTEGVLDLSHLAGKGVFVTWDSGDQFFQVFISPESGAITWPQEIDIDTYNVYCKLKGTSPDALFRQKEIHA